MLQKRFDMTPCLWLTARRRTMDKKPVWRTLKSFENRWGSTELPDGFWTRSYLCEVLQPRWDPHRDHGWHSDWGRCDTPVFWSWDRARLVHDRGWALVVAHVEARRRGLVVVSVATGTGRVRGDAVVPWLGHRVGHLVGRVWVNWERGKKCDIAQSSFTLSNSANSTN